MKIIQGIEYKHKVTTDDAFLAFTNGINKYIFDTVTTEGTDKYIVISAEESSAFIPGNYSYQVFDNNDIIEEGTLFVKANLKYSSDTANHWAKILKAIDDRLAGKALDPTQDVTVGDKRLSYYSLDDLLKLRQFVIDKVAEEKAIEEGKEAVSRNDQRTIKYAWSIQ